MTVASVAEHMRKVPPQVRPALQAARRLIKSVAPRAEETAYDSAPPRSRGTMWKIARYVLDGRNVAGIGTFADHAGLYFYRGRELDDGSGLLQGGGKEMRSITLRSAADVERAAVKSLVRRAFEPGR